MAANMQHMAAGGQMMPQQQQMRKAASSNQLQQYVYQNMMQNTPPPNGLSWQSNVPINERMGKALNLITNITLAMNGADQQRVADYGCNFEREMFLKSPNKEAYDTAIGNKRLEFFKKRQANESSLQNNLNNSAQAQAQAEAMMNMQAQMGRGVGGVGQAPQQGFQHMQHQMQVSQIPGQPQPQQAQMQAQQTQQQTQQQQQQQQMNMAMGLGMGMAGQAGRGVGPNPQMAAMGMQAAQNRGPQQFASDMSRLNNADKGKVNELAQKIMSQAPEEQKNDLRLQLQQRMPAHQLAEIQASGKDPLIWFYQNQAFQVLKANMNRLSQQGQGQGQGRPQNQNAAQAAMMMQQHSQQSMQQRPNMMNNAQQGQAGDFSQFANLESIKDQQLNGLMAQQAGQMVVPASGAGPRNPTPQNMNQNMPPNQPGPNQTPRPQQQQVLPQQQTPQQPQQAGLNLQQMKMNQAAQQSQAQLQLQAQAHIKQMQSQQGAMGVPPSQSPAMNNLNAPAPRQPNNMNAMGAQGMGQGNVQFGDQRFNQGIQRPNSQAFQNMLANMTPEQRQTVNGLPPDKLNEVVRRWHTQREQQMAMNAGQMNQGQMQNLQQNQFNRMGQNTPGPVPQGMPQQPGAPGIAGQQQMQTPRGTPQPGAAQAMMDSMDLPPQVVNQIGRLPPEVKKWRDLKIWLSQNNSNLPQAMRSSLGTLQQRQFHLVMQRRQATMPPGQQQVQPPAMNAANVPTPGPQMGNVQPGMQRPMGTFPPQVLQATPQELMQVRNRGPQFATMADEQLRAMVIQMKKTTWTNQQQQLQMRAQAQAQMQGQQPGVPNPMSMPQAPMQLKQPPQPNQVPQTQPLAQPQPTGPPMAQQAAMQAGNQRPNQTPNQQMRNAQQQANRAQAPNTAAGQGQAKNLKRPSTDDTAAEAAAAAAKPAAPAQRPALQQPNQQGQNPIRQLTPQQIATLTPDQRAKYEQMLRNHMANRAAAQNGQGTQGGNQEVLARLKTLGQEEHQQFTQEVFQEIPMNPQEYTETAAKLKRLISDVHKIGRGLNKWYSLTRDDARARMFFRIRLRIISQFVDGEAAEVVKDVLTVRSSELDNSRAMLESMAKDLAASVYGRNHMKPAGQNAQGTPMNTAGQLPQQPQASPAQLTQPQQPQTQGQPAALNAANLEKNSQQLNKLKKGANKAAQAPAAPTAAQPPFSFGGATSPHGNPSYVGNPKNMNLQLPPARKKQKMATQGPAVPGATPSPKTGKNASPEMQRAAEPQQQPPAKPVFLCQDAECDKLSVGFPNEKMLQRHVEEEHTKPRENPVKFVGEILASALGLENDGTAKKDQRPVAQAMSATTSKQGQTPSMAGTPKLQEAVMRSASALGKPSDTKVGGKSGVAAKSDAKEADMAAFSDPWAGATIDPQSLLRNLGFENGIPGVIADFNAFRSLTPKDTPESSKDGVSEPNSDISDGAALDIDLRWQTLDSDLLFNLDSANLDGDMPELDAILNPPPGANRGPAGLPLSEWDDLEMDFSKPFQFDTSLYSMAV